MVEVWFNGECLRLRKVWRVINLKFVVPFKVYVVWILLAYYETCMMKIEDLNHVMNSLRCNYETLGNGMFKFMALI